MRKFVDCLYSKSMDCLYSKSVDWLYTGPWIDYTQVRRLTVCKSMDCVDYNLQNASFGYGRLSAGRDNQTVSPEGTENYMSLV